MTHEMAKKVACPECGSPTRVTCAVITIQEQDEPVSVNVTSRDHCRNEVNGQHAQVPDERWADAWRIS